MIDKTEGMRRLLAGDINAEPGSRPHLEACYGQVWDTDQLCTDFIVYNFAAPFVVVGRRSDGAKGSMMFQHSPRFYWGFKCD
jgi:hypothetical protein